MMTVMSVPPGGVERRSILRGGRATRSTADLQSPAAGIDGLTPGVGRWVRRQAGADPLAVLHSEHYASLVRLASLVLGDVGLAEQVVQDAFVKLHLRWGGLRQLDRAPAYLRSCVLNGARSQLRHQKVRDRHDARRTVAPAAGTPEGSAIAAAEHERVVATLRQLPDRKWGPLALRYFLDLPEAEIAAAMGVSAGSVKTHVHRGLAALAQLLGEDDR
jgi:RNA polymerase sigma factor (sigma-70 family)